MVRDISEYGDRDQPRDRGDEMETGWGWDPLICISISITVMYRSSVRAVHMCIYVHVYVCTLIGVGKEVNRQI